MSATFQGECVSVRIIAMLMAAALVLGACRAPADTTDSEPDPADRDVATETTSDGGGRPPTAAELAATAPIDLMVDLGPDGWDAAYNNGAGIEVTEDNWARAYQVSQKDARAEIAAAEEADLKAAATEQWRHEPQGSDAGWSSLRLTVRQYTSRQGIDADGWSRRGTRPEGVRVPDGINLGCTDAAEQSYYYDGAHYADCTVFVDDTTVVYLSSIAPDAATAASGAADGIAEWLGSVTAPAG
jgi:hypothetical protein